MPSVTYSYVYFNSGKHRRQPRGPDSGFVPVPGMQGGVIQNVEPPSTVPVPPLPGTWSAGHANFVFSFVNVSGGTSGGGASFNYLELPPPAAVGTTPINITAVYLQSSRNGGNGGDSGATIDAFDESTNQLVSDNFVTVYDSNSTTPDVAQTQSGNVWGFVDTARSSEKIVAAPNITSMPGKFDKWVNLADPGSTAAPVAIVGPDLTVSMRTSAYALAWYKSTPPDICATTVAGIEQAIGDPIGPLMTPSELAAVEAILENCVREGQLTQVFVTNLINRYKNYARTRGEQPPRPPRP